MGKRGEQRAESREKPLKDVDRFQKDTYTILKMVVSQVFSSPVVRRRIHPLTYCASVFRPADLEHETIRKWVLGIAGIEPGRWDHCSSRLVGLE
jgi:hypothetical protein